MSLSEDSTNKNSDFKWTQAMGAMAASLGSAACGVTAAYSSEAIPQLLVDPQLKMDLYSCSWFGKKSTYFTLKYQKFAALHMTFVTFLAKI